VQITFEQSEQSTLGVEWELALIDATTAELVPLAPQVLAGLDSPLVTGEFLTNTVELVTGVCRTVAEAEVDLRRGAELVRGRAQRQGLDVFAGGTHPFSTWRAQDVSSGETYQKMLERTQHWGRQMVIYGVHVHVGIDRRDKVLPTLSAMLTYYPHLLALSASSPFWEGEDTGYASQRALLFQQLPTAGLPFQFGEWATYEAFVDDLMTTGVIDTLGENRWDLRPAPHLGTLELRVCDSVGTLPEVSALTALTQCLVEECSRTLDSGGTLVELPPWHVQENKWRAARYGLDAIVVTGPDNAERLVTDDLADLLERLAPVADDLGCADELAGVVGILTRGAGYQRQRALADQHRGDLRALVRALAAETAAA
jgi:glutamate---cysteine ligase / carboxylate-amine ligase